jgi:hypothetical protein
MKTWTAVIFCLLLFPWGVQSAEFYRWTDENGVSHVTDQPPATPAKNVKTYRFQKPTEPVVPESKVVGETPGAAVERQPEGGQSAEKQQGQDINQELEKARTEYEEAKSHETEYRRNFNDSYGYGRDRSYWRGKLEDIENKKQQLENLESGGAAGGGTSSPNPPKDQTPR